MHAAHLEMSMQYGMSNHSVQKPTNAGMLSFSLPHFLVGWRVQEFGEHALRICVEVILKITMEKG